MKINWGPIVNERHTLAGIYKFVRLQAQKLLKTFLVINTLFDTIFFIGTVLHLRYKMGRGQVDKSDEFPISLFCHL